MSLKNKLNDHIVQKREEIKSLLSAHGDKAISEVKLSQVFGGMRGITALVCYTSSVDPEKGLMLRGTPVKALADKDPLEIFYLLCTGELPTADDWSALSQDVAAHSEMPEYVWDVVRAMPRDSHPMAMLNTGILVMQRESIFAKKYAQGTAKSDLWEPALDDAITIIGRIATLGAGIYRIRCKGLDPIPPKNGLGWAQNYAHMTGLDNPRGEFSDLIRLFFTLHCDHGAGNVSAFTASTIGSALSDPYYAVSGGLNGLAGPLHGLANQECLRFVKGVYDHFKGVPGDDELKAFVWDHLNGGKVIPGYGHAVLRVTDPRFSAFYEFGSAHCTSDSLFQIVGKLFAIVPDILKEHGKATSPWPNVDAASGALLNAYGMVEHDYYTVLFSVSRSLGLLSQYILSKGLGQPITRPKAITLDWIKKAFG